MSIKPYIQNLLSETGIDFEISEMGFYLQNKQILFSELEQVILAKNDVLSLKYTDDLKITKARVLSFLGLSKTVFARKTKICRIDANMADEFLIEHHFAGTVKTKFKFGLYLKSELIAVACFSGKRNFKEKQGIELVRYASKGGITVVGGLSKLIKAAFELLEVNEIMTYVDQEYSTGSSFKKIGFEETGISQPIGFNIENNKRIYCSNSKDSAYYNLGNYILRKSRT